MKAIQIDRWVSPDELGVVETPRPEIPAGHVLIRTFASPVTFALSLMIAGKYQRKPALPFIPGNTSAGLIETVGAGCNRFHIGDRVVASVEHGGLAQYVAAHEANVYGIPDTVSFAQATAFNSSYNSVLAALSWPRLLDLQHGQTLLVLGASGGVGMAAIEIGRILGAKVIAAASTDEKRQAALACGAHHAVAADPDSLRDEVMAITDSKGVDAVLDPVGGKMFHEALRCMAREGRIVPLGFASGEIPQASVNILLVKNINVCGLYMGYYKIDAREQFEDRVRGLFDQLGDWCAQGRIKPCINSSFALAETPRAFERVLDRNHIGHVLVEPWR